MPMPDDNGPESSSNAIWIAGGLVIVIALLVIGFFVMDTVIGRQ